jgi:hypothetical protein
MSRTFPQQYLDVVKAAANSCRPDLLMAEILPEIGVL